MENKEPFDIDKAVVLLRKAVKPFAKAALFQLYDEGYKSPFEILTACIISVRTRDEVTVVASKRLFAKAGTYEEVAGKSVEEINALISDSTFHYEKAGNIKRIAERIIEENLEDKLCDKEILLSFRGVGEKCANLALGIACNQPFISVDIHVHRVTNRWGIVSTSAPEKTMYELEKILPQKYRIEINSLLVPFGKHICRGGLPKCNSCPLLRMCMQTGIQKHI